MVQGHIRGLSLYYADGVERMEIWINKKKAYPLPFKLGKRVPIHLRVGAHVYLAGLRSTENNDYVWICSNLKNDSGEDARLTEVLKKNGFKINNLINISIKKDIIIISHAQ